jgi:hypothetical protein
MWQDAFQTPKFRAIAAKQPASNSLGRSSPSESRWYCSSQLVLLHHPLRIFNHRNHEQTKAPAPGNFRPVLRTGSTSATRLHSHRAETLPPHYNCLVPKRPCIHRAEWRLLRGKAAQPLPAHYRLECDYGTPLVAIYRDGEGENPLYLCAQHATAERGAAADRTPLATLAPNQDSASDAAALPPQNDLLADPSRPQVVDALESAKRPEPASSNESKSSEPIAPTRDEQTQSVEISAPKPELFASKPSASSAPNTIPLPADSNASASDPLAVEPRASAPVPKPAPIPSAKAAPPKPAPPKTNASAKPPARDLAYGNPAKALVDETIWNLQPGDFAAYTTALRQGKSPLDAAQAAGGQLTVIHRKIHEYTAKIESLLSASNAALDAQTLIQNIHTVLDRETLNIISDDAIADDGKDAAVARLGEFQEWINRGLHAGSTPLDAHRIAVAIADRANWGAASMSAELTRVHRLAHTAIRDAIRAAFPEIRDTDERLANLYAARSEIDAAFHSETSAPAGLPAARSAVVSAPQERVAGV